MFWGLPRREIEPDQKVPTPSPTIPPSWRPCRKRLVKPIFSDLNDVIFDSAQAWARWLLKHDWTRPRGPGSLCRLAVASSRRWLQTPSQKLWHLHSCKKRGVYFKEFIDDDDDNVFKHFNIQAYYLTQGTQPQFPLALGGVSGVQPRDLDCTRPVRQLPRPQPPPLCTRPRFERNPSSCSCKYCSKCVCFQLF